PLLWPGPSGSVHGGDAPVTKSVHGGDACGQRCREVCMAPAAVAGPSGIARGGEGIGAQSVHGGCAVAKDKNVQGERIKRQEITCVCVLPISSSFFFTIPWDETQKESIWSMKQGEWVVLFLL
ncbi:MAG: hypothetical protein UHS51_00305, partial [Atopobiaceae bacterium]|nr:hypothetical protein [Atopobiaceae bacterium]